MGSSAAAMEPAIPASSSRPATSCVMTAIENPPQLASPVALPPTDAGFPSRATSNASIETDAPIPVTTSVSSTSAAGA